MRVGEDADRLIAALAGAQHGVVERRQLLALGVSREQIAVRARKGQLFRLHRGVYLVGHNAAPPLAAKMAAVLACGPRSVISHRSAAALWRILADSLREIELTITGDVAREHKSLRVYRSATLIRRDVRRIEGIPVTSPARTLLDLSSQLRPAALEQAAAEAQARHLVRRSELQDQLNRHPGRPGTPSLHALVNGAQPSLTRSEAETRLLALIRSAGLPEPEANHSLDPYEPDLLWRNERVVVEFDSWQFHRTRAAFEADRRRDGELAARGYTVIRVTWRQLTAEPHAVVARIAAALARAGAAQPASE